MACPHHVIESDAMKIKTQKNGWWTALDKTYHNGMWTVKIYNAAGNLTDKVRTDDYKNALGYWKTFNLIAKNGA